jgi:hypothetical protein
VDHLSYQFKRIIGLMYSHFICKGIFRNKDKFVK